MDNVVFRSMVVVDNGGCLAQLLVSWGWWQLIVVDIRWWCLLGDAVARLLMVVVYVGLWVGFLAADYSDQPVTDG